MYRQGDVLIERIVSIPHYPISHERLLVRGEGRNHGHFINGDGVAVYKAPQDELTDGGGIVTHYLDVEDPGVLEHLLIDSNVWTREHAPIHIPPGKYRVIRQREYNPYAKAIRQVND
jgi:hypothetical protein